MNKSTGNYDIAARLTQLQRALGVDTEEAEENGDIIRSHFISRRLNHLIQGWWVKYFTGSRIGNKSTAPLLRKLETVINPPMPLGARVIPVQTLNDVGRLIGASAGNVKEKQVLVELFEKHYQRAIAGAPEIIPFVESEFSTYISINDKITVYVTLGWYPVTSDETVKVYFDAQGNITTTSRDNPVIRVAIVPTPEGQKPRQSQILHVAQVAQKILEAP